MDVVVDVVAGVLDVVVVVAAEALVVSVVLVVAAEVPVVPVVLAVVVAVVDDDRDAYEDDDEIPPLRL